MLKNLLWSGVVLTKNPESAMSETETRSSQNAFDSKILSTATLHITQLMRHGAFNFLEPKCGQKFLNSV